MVDWKVAASLDRLRAQLGDIAPKRSLASDGAIGDAAHATRDSDHNPWFVLAGQALVTARDFTHDPAGGLDCQQLADALRAGRDPRIKYVIWREQIMSGGEDYRPWVWRPYSGSNPHTKHLHLSVVADARCNSAITWKLPARLSSAAPTAPSTPSGDVMTPEQEKRITDRLDAMQRQIDLMKPGVRLPGRARTDAHDVLDDEYGWTLTAAGRAGDVLAEVRALAKQAGAGPAEVDYDRLAAALAPALLDGLLARRAA